MSESTSPRASKPLREDLPAKVLSALSLEEQRKDVLQSKKIAKCVEQLKPEDDRNTLILPDQSPHEIAFVLEYINKPTKSTGLVIKPMICPDYIGDGNVEDGPVPFTPPVWQYIWGTQHGLDTLCAKGLDLYKYAFGSPWSALDRDWNVLKELTKNGLADSELSKILIEGKAWQMRYFGLKDMPRYYGHLIGDPELMFRVMAALSGVNMKQCLGG